MQPQITNYIKEEKFKETEIGLIPENWELVKLKDIAKIKLGRTPERKKKEYWEDGKIPWVKVGDLNNTIIYDTSEKISEIAFKEKFHQKFIPKGTLLFSFKLTIGKVGILGMDAVHNEAIASLFVDENKVDKYFLFFLLPLLNFKTLLDRYVKGNTLNREKLKILPIPLPPLLEQRKIAYVLLAIQKAIEQQYKIIEAAKNLKKSLMKKLFTEGTKGEEQRETEIGPIPKSWKVIKLESTIEFTKKRKLSTKNFEEIPFIPMEMIPTDKFMIEGYILKSPEEIKSGIYCEKGDILLAKITPCFENGKRGIVENIPLNFAYATTEVFPIKPKGIDKLFLFYLLIRPEFRHTIASKMEGITGRKRAPKEVLKNTKIPLPPLPEQQEIAHILNTVDKKIEVEEKRKATLKAFFKTILHKLMTGEIRLKNVELGVEDVS